MPTRPSAVIRTRSWRVVELAGVVYKVIAAG